MRWRRDNSGWNWRFAILPIFVGGSEEWIWLEAYYARSHGYYTLVRSVAEHRAALAAPEEG